MLEDKNEITKLQKIWLDSTWVNPLNSKPKSWDYDNSIKDK
jgi:hypothetical protein